MSAFLTRLRVDILHPSELSGGRQVYELIEDFTYQSYLLGTITAPLGMRTDFASIPRIAWRYIDPEDPVILMPSVIHDTLYNLRGTICGRPYTREQADLVLREAMRVCGARWDQCAVVHRAVRLFGGSHWKS